MEFVTFWANPRILFYLLLLAVLYKQPTIHHVSYRTINGAFRRRHRWRRRLRISRRHHQLQTMDPAESDRGQVQGRVTGTGEERRVPIPLLQPLNYGWDGEMGSQMPNNHFHSSSCGARP